MTIIALQVVVLALLQTTILPYLALSAIDLCVVLLVIYAVREKLSTTIAIAACLALVMETYGAAPFGSYFGSYWLIILSVHSLRNLVVWNLSVPWLVAFVVAEGVVIIVESLMVGFTHVHLGTYLLQAVLRVVATCGAGFVWLQISKPTRKRQPTVQGHY